MLIGGSNNSSRSSRVRPRAPLQPIHTCLPACLPACLPTYLPISLPMSLRVLPNNTLTYTHREYWMKELRPIAVPVGKPYKQL
jgi:hypothetical protein